MDEHWITISVAMASAVTAPEVTKPNEVSSQGWSFDQVEKITKPLVIFVALIYSLGMLVTNRYLMYYGISDFSSLKPRYIFTGVWAASMICCAALPGAAGFVTIVKLKWSWLKVLIAILGSLAVGAVAFYFIAFWLLPSYLLGIYADELWFVEIAIALCYLFLAVTSIIAYNSFKKHPRIAFTYVVISSIATSLFVIIAISKPNVYGQIPEAVGGGKPMAAILILNSQGANVWRQAGMPIAKDTISNTDEIEIIYQDDHNLYVKGSYDRPEQIKTKMIIISRSLVDLILPERNY